MKRVLLLAAAAMAKYEECHLYRSAVIARERAPAPSRRRLLPKPITNEPKKPKNSITFLVVSRARSGTDWLRAMLNDHRRVCMEAEMAALRTWAATAGASYLPLQYDELRRDPVGVVSRIYEFLGVEPHETRPDLYARSMRKPLSEYVENLDEVRAALRGTPWAADPVLTA